MSSHGCPLERRVALQPHKTVDTPGQRCYLIRPEDAWERPGKPLPPHVGGGRPKADRLGCLPELPPRLALHRVGPSRGRWSARRRRSMRSTAFASVPRAGWQIRHCCRLPRRRCMSLSITRRGPKSKTAWRDSTSDHKDLCSLQGCQGIHETACD